MDAEKEGVVVPLTLEDYCIKPKSKPSNQEMAVSDKKMQSVLMHPLTEKKQYYFQLDLTDFYDEDYDLDTDDDNQDSDGSDYANGDDSGNGET